MEKKEIYESLCYYDIRNPDCTSTAEELEEYKEHLKEPRTRCFCDNCFRGKTKLAEELLLILDLYEKLNNSHTS